MFRFVQINKARCLKCGDIVISSPEEPSVNVPCTCGKLVISGGATSLLRTGKQGIDFEELSKLNFENQCRGVREDVQDPPPDQERFIKDLSNQRKRI